MPAFTGQKDLLGYLRTLWRWKTVFLAFVIGVPALALVVDLARPQTYQSSALIGVNQTTVNTGTFGNVGSFSTSNVSAIAELVTTTPVADVAAGLVRPPADPSQIDGEVSAVPDTTTNFIKISAEDRNPQRAADIANAFARAISLNRQQAAISQLNDSIIGIDAQLAHLGPGSGQAGTRSTLLQQRDQLRAARSLQGSNAAILEPATASSTPAGGGLRRLLEIALVIGILLGLGAVLMAENADRRLRAPDELEAMTEMPLLATIPPSAFSSRLMTTRQDDEAFNMLYVALTYFNVERPVRSVVITSPGEKEGKTTVSTRLALAAARAGTHVALVDGDLRRGQVAGRLGMENRPGLAAVLSGELSLDDALAEPAHLGIEDGRLTVLQAGPVPPNPSALMSSPEMVSVVRELEAQHQLVIVDTPAALAVGDALPLMRSVTGVILVARMDHSSRRTIRRLQGVISAAHGTLLGVVATGVTAATGYYDGYSRKYYREVSVEPTNGRVPVSRGGEGEPATGSSETPPPQ